MRRPQPPTLGTEVQGELQWGRIGGGIRHYRGPLEDLGHGIPRNTPSWGIRRAVFDAAFGYVSGFPKRDIIWYVLTRSLWPTWRIPVVEIEYVEDD